MNRLSKKISVIKTSLLMVFLMAFLGLNPKVLLAQTKAKRDSIISTYDRARANEITLRLANEWEEARLRALEFARANKLEIRRVLPDSSIVELVKLDKKNLPIFYRTFNTAASKTTRTDYLTKGNFLWGNVLGENMVMGLWDAGHARASHEEFQNVQNKVSVGDNVRPNVTLHATHIAGTIAGAGVNVSAQGMAPSAQISTNDWTYDAVEVADLALNQGLLISNHSYGCDTEWLGDRGYSYVFGAYINESLVWDELMYEAPYYLMVVAAGNDGTHSHNEAPLDPSFPIFDKLAGKAVAKNNLVVAASYPAEIDENGNLLDVMMATFSSQGPTDDLRIKPDITGQGVGLLSTGYNSDNEYIRMGGTSMATPNVSGTLLLLQQYVERKHKHYFRGATLKGLVLHTADDIGPKGPDAFSGWGLLNAKKRQFS